MRTAGAPCSRLWRHPLGRGGGTGAFARRGRIRPRSVAGVVVAAVCGAMAVLPEARAQDLIARWVAQDTATGDWGGLRTRLLEAGIDPQLNFTTDILGNPVGGLRQGAAYAGMWYGETIFDLETLAGINGLRLVVGAAWTQGRDLSGEDIGNLFDVAEVYNGNALRLAELFLEESLFDERVGVALGRLAVGDAFATAGSFDYYVNSAVNSSPASILVNVPSFTTAPYAGWGARVLAQPRDDVTLMFALYNADTGVQSDARHGLDFTFNPWDGVLAVAELGIDPNTGVGATGLPGHYAIGGYYDTSRYTFLADPNRTRRGNLGVYAIAEQMVWRESPDSPEGLTLWGTVTVNPDDDINTLPLALYGGATYRGLLPGRVNDVTAFGVSYGAFSDALPGQSAEWVLELNHRFQFGDWLSVTPDLQYVIDPDGAGIADALVAGVEISIDF